MSQTILSNWWKIAGLILVLYSIIGGLLIDVPRLDILNETIRNLYYHVSLWFAMMIIMTISLFHSVKYLSNQSLVSDARANFAAQTGLFLGILGIATGSIWAKFTWGTFWVSDPKLNGAAVTILIYLAYSVLRNSVEEPSKRAKLASVYNIFSYAMLVVFLLILPRMTDSLHPGNGGNPGFSAYEEDLDSTMRLVFYPAILGWTLIALWLINIKMRLFNISNSVLNRF